VDADGATGSSTATATSSSGKISTSQDSVSNPGATSSSASASATATEEGLTTDTTVSTPVAPPESVSTSPLDEVVERFTEPQDTTVDFLIGLPEEDIIVGAGGFEIIYGQDGADRFEVSANQPDASPFPDVIVDFSLEQGDSLLISGVTNLDEIELVTVDLDQDSNGDGVFINNIDTEKVYAIILNTPDVLELRDQVVLSDTVTANMP
jgi:hypothetical protein